MAATMKLTLLVVLLIAAAATVLPRTEAAAFVVGDTTGWTTPSGNAAFYTSWAAKHNFSVGDILGELRSPRYTETYIPPFSMVSLFVELCMIIY